jgi:hypothetical protein
MIFTHEKQVPFDCAQGGLSTSLGMTGFERVPTQNPRPGGAWTGHPKVVDGTSRTTTLAEAVLRLHSG